MDGNRLWVRWLEVLGGAIIALGVFLAVAGGSGVSGLLNDRVLPVFWGDENPSAAAADFRVWVYALLGATMVGWGIAVVALARYGLSQGFRWAWWAVVLGVAAWYLLDTTASIVAGVWFNVALNSAILVAAAIPLIALGRRTPS